ncbi:MAG TPA: acyl-CoA reductase [Candidatus Tumulicola sp.]
MTLDKRPVRSIVNAVAETAAAWNDRDFPPRVRAFAAVRERTGYSEPVVGFAFDRLFGALTSPAIESSIAGELGSLDALDDFVAMTGRPPSRALPIGRICILSSRTTIGVAVVPAIFALCAKCPVLVKDREDALVAAFFQTLAPRLGGGGNEAVARAWDGPGDNAEFDGFAAVVAFGDDATIATIRRALLGETRLIAFGSKASCGYIGRAALSDVASAQCVAAGAAADLVLYDTEGCLSLHALFVERGGGVEPHAFAALLARAVERAAVEFPLGSRDALAAARTAGARDLAAFRSAAGAGVAFADRDAGYLVLLDPPRDEPPPFLPRALAVFSVDSPEEAAAYVARHRIPIEAVAIAGSRPEIRAMAVRAGAARVAPFGRLQTPTLGGFHGGRPRIAEFVRWIADET